MRAHPEERLLLPALAGFGRAAKDVASASPRTRKLRLVADVRSFDALPDLRRLHSLWSFAVDARRLETIARCPGLEHLYIDSLKTSDLTPLTALRGLVTLRLESSTSIGDLGVLEDFSGLLRLGIEHFPKVRSLEPIGKLRELRGLDVSGSMWTRMTVASLGPIEHLGELRFLRLTNLAAEDGSLEPLAHLQHLDRLVCGNLFEMHEFARLSARLPKTACPWFEPLGVMSGFPCPRCGAAQVMLTGRGKPTLCRRCHRDRVRRHIDAFNEARLVGS